ncbi:MULTISPECIES: hypothetical protein [Pseudanabaena]|uniref:hypothetical protein n=1 Tax=Pseudanabaena TaxID=1152 RepID=UPI00247905A2|nr:MULTISPECIES: hypothetical protein [Pseudanabaena]MEA5488588.1 hypothetical protein [Pseudanabaena sp. CCNP1317]WGS71019.1 hypothetical protein OA858_14990 [Pseudanabaena galeata CCNP1313]
MPSGNLELNRYRIVYSPDIALAMYRELASHLEQIDENINAELFWQESTEFSYLGSQIGGLWLTYPQSIPEQFQVLIKKILNHYGVWASEPNLAINF